ncbi:3-isopropylmalate dehydrogenase [Savitreella phatthalungensis]
MSKHILLLPGDGIGPDVVAEAKKVIEVFGDKFTTSTALFGGCSIDAHGTSLTEDTLAQAKAADAILMGAVGGPKWGTGKVRPEQGLLRLRSELDVYANIRPCSFPAKGLLKLSPLKEELAQGTDITVVRELCGGAYFGKRVEAADTDGQRALDEWPYSLPEIERIVRVAAKMAQDQGRPLHSIDKANVLATSRLWRSTTERIVQEEFKDVKLDHHLVDSAAMSMVRTPKMFNGICVTENLMGDILSDLLSAVPGTLGVMPSASIADTPPCKGLYEPIHGSAPDIAGMGIANPVGTILSVAMMLELTFEMHLEAKALRDAVAKVLESKEHGGLEIRTKDLRGTNSTQEVGQAIVEQLKKNLGHA